jgi:hypothetical protein
MVFGILFVYRSLPVVLSLRRYLTRPEPPMDKVILAKESFSKSVYYQDPGLGVITDIETTGGNSMVLVGQSSAVFLNSNLQPRGIAYYPTCTSEMTFVNWSTGAFFCRGSWSSDVALYDRKGRLVWTYSGGVQGIDNAVAGHVDGSEAVIVGLNGDGGVHRVDSHGKELWQQPDGNVWHVEIVTPDDGTAPMILHSNTEAQLVLRDGAGNIVGHSKPETYVTDFSLTAWDDHPARNDLITTRNGFFYILTMRGYTVARLSAPGTSGADQAKGTPVRWAASHTSYAALVHLPRRARSALYIYDRQQRLVYQEALGRECGALLAQTNSSGNQDLLLGCDGLVWKYSQK